MSVVAKDITRINLKRLSRLFINVQSDPKKAAEWHEQGHFLSGFDYKLQAIRETHGDGTISANCGYRATGTFESAQNQIVDFANYIFRMKGKCGVAMLVGDKLIVHNWYKDGLGVQHDRRISIVADPAYNAMLKASGTIAGWVDQFQMYTVKNLVLQGTQLTYTVLESLFAEGIRVNPTPGIAI